MEIDTSLEHLFLRITALVRASPSTVPDYIFPYISLEQVLELYGLYKQGAEGYGLPKTPETDDSMILRKWKAWEIFSRILPQQAQQLYLVKILPYFEHITNLSSNSIDQYIESLESETEKAQMNVLFMDCRILYEEMSKTIPSFRDISPQYSNSNSPPGDFDDASSQFSYEDIAWGETVNGSTRSSISSIGSFAHISSDPENDIRAVNIVGPISISPTSTKSFSISSVSSVRLNPSVPLTPPGGNSRNPSVSSIETSNFILKSPPSRHRTSSMSQRDLFTVKEDPSQSKPIAPETRIHKGHTTRYRRHGAEPGQPTSRRLNETSALLHTTSHRIDQGMALLLQTLQRLEFLEKKVEGVVSKRPSIHTSHGRASSPGSPDPDRVQLYSSPRKHCSSQATNVIIRSSHTSPVESRASSTC